jgi:hypothetical protein
MKKNPDDFNIIGVCPEDFLYCEIFFLQLSRPLLKKYNINMSQNSILAYLPCTLQDQCASKRGTDKKKNILFYAPCALYVLSVVNVLDRDGRSDGVSD